MIVRRGRFVYEGMFTEGGENDVVLLDIVNDEAQGLGVPAKSFTVINYGGGGGYNILYFSTSENGIAWDRRSMLLPNTAETYDVGDNVIVSQIKLWATNAMLRFAVRATPGEWSISELKRYVRDPILRSGDVKEKEEKWKVLEEGI